MTWWNQKIISFLISPPPLLGSHKLNAKHYARSTCHIDLLTKKTVCMSWTHSSTLDRSQHYEQKVKLPRSVVFLLLYSLGLWFVQRFFASALQSLRFWSCNQLSVKSWRRARAWKFGLNEVPLHVICASQGRSTPCILLINSSHPKNDKESL